MGKQLKMYRLATLPFCELVLPEGYSFSNYKDESDKSKWVECCKNGLVSDEANEETFDDIITRHDFVNVEKDVFFLDFNGEHIATATAVHHTNDNSGELHMVGMKTEFRGKGLGKYINNIAVKKLLKDGVSYIELTTDEWRVGAVKSYLSAGFLPVKYDLGMVSRWEYMLTVLGIDECEMLNEDATVFGTVHRRDRDKDDRVARIGVFGAGRGRTMMDYCKNAKNAKLVAVCDFYEPALAEIEKDFGEGIALYTDFNEFIKHDMDAVVLANFANEHAPFAIKCMENGKNVLSEVLPVQTLKEAVELAECVEKTGRIYAYAENYCYMPAPRRMREMYNEKLLGEFEYGEGEYMHNCEPGWHRYTRGLPEHWRNTMYSTYYCTHSVGPIIHITGLRPVSVTGFETPINARMRRMGAKAGHTGMEIITLENGALVRSIHGVGCSKCSIWYSIYGTNGTAESSRELAGLEGVKHLYAEYDDSEVAYDGMEHHKLDIDPEDTLTAESGNSGHGGSDFYTTYYFAESLLGEKNAEIIDIYEALDMFLPGLFAYRSILAGNIPMAIPDFRNKEVREQYRKDVACTDKKVAGDSLLPSYSKGDPEIPSDSYEIMQKHFEEYLKTKE